jgi:hypothetical protein
MVTSRTTGAFSQTATVGEERVAVGFGNTVTVAVPPVNPEVLTQPVASVTLVKEKVVVDRAETLKATPLTTLLTVVVVLVPPEVAVRTRVYGPIPATFDVYNKVAADPSQIMLPVRLPLGSGFTVTTALPLVTVAQPPALDTTT